MGEKSEQPEYAYHYTLTTKALKILKSREIVPCVEPTRLTAVWFSAHPVWDRGMGTLVTIDGEDREYDFETMAEGPGLVRFGVRRDALLSVKDACGCGLMYLWYVNHAFSIGAQPSDWYVYPDNPFPVQAADKWEGYAEGRWQDLTPAVMDAIWERRCDWVRRGSPIPQAQR